MSILIADLEYLDHVRTITGRELWDYSFKYGYNWVTLRFVAPRDYSPKVGDLIYNNGLTKEDNGNNQN